MKYKCLVLDHDDTVVKSTPEIHFPSFLKTLEKLRPELKMTLEEFMLYCFEPGFNKLCFEVLGFSEEEMAYQLQVWEDYVNTHVPVFYEGMREIIARYKAEGGIVCVVSHSSSSAIRRDYKENGGIQPDRIFGWELGEEKRKPQPYPLQEIMRTYKLLPSDLLMVDDLKPGYDMARSCQVDFACAGWSQSVPSIIEYMHKNCDYYLEEVKELEKLLFKKEEE
ncbi:hydrolase [Sporanaerobium hydrogeniformans]|uniref:Hydrolase n=1 Tax=Sporanaerobium hydrogeniformans TaxID=3072179 RepID=A0AC61DEP7_9FIRM|nr:hydrolase [Sporanaerobium hydrogeniformans]